MIINIVELMKALEYIQGSSLTAEDKRSVAKELKSALPAEVLCSSASKTHQIASSLFDKAIEPEARPNDRTEQRSESPKDHSEETKHIPAVGSRPDQRPRDAGKADGRLAKVSGGRR